VKLATFSRPAAIYRRWVLSRTNIYAGEGENFGATESSATARETDRAARESFRERGRAMRTFLRVRKDARAEARNPKFPILPSYFTKLLESNFLCFAKKRKIAS
jgi:hypothetical protein